MRVRRLIVQNFRGVATGTVDFSGHTLLVGGNNVGKSTVCEALDLVLGPERLYRRPVVDEHDFHRSVYRDAEGKLIEISITAVLLDIGAEAQRRFRGHLRRWNETTSDFADFDGNPTAADAADVSWALPVTFLGRYNPAEDDFDGGTFFAHEMPGDVDEEEAARLGGGLRPFTREHKRLCGFVFLRTVRTGSRALSLQRGSLLDTVLRLAGLGATEMWETALGQMKSLDPAIGDIKQLAQIREEIRSRLGQFINLAPGSEATGFFASDLTRDHLREFVRLFISAQPGDHPVPFERLGTGSVNLLVFALLTFIASLKGEEAVIFAMEEPELALSPHTQRRIIRTVLEQMGQTIVTSHSPYVIERFGPEQIVMLDRKGGALVGRPVSLGGEKPKMFRTEQRQFAEAILARAVLVVEGQTEAEMFPAASSVLERLGTPPGYAHLDFSGISVFDAKTETNVPKYGPIFHACGKPAYSFRDTPNVPPNSDAEAKLATYKKSWVSPKKGTERLLTDHATIEYLLRFLGEAMQRDDYPVACGRPDLAGLDELHARELANAILKARKGDGYAALFVSLAKCFEELPPIVCEVLIELDAVLRTPEVPEAVPPMPSPVAVGEPT